MVNWFRGLDTKWRIAVLAIIAFLIVVVVGSIFGGSETPDSTQTIPGTPPPPSLRDTDSTAQPEPTPNSVNATEILETPTPRPEPPRQPSEETDGELKVSSSGCDDDYDRDEWATSNSKWTEARQATARDEGPDLAGYWTGISIAGLSEADIDHHVPLRHAHIAGGCYWIESQRNSFYLDLDNLNVTTPSMNRSKSDKAPGHWDRQDEFIDTPAERCEYATQWVNIKRKYKLHFITAREVSELTDMLSECGETMIRPAPAYTATPTMPPVSTPTPTMTATPIPTGIAPGDVKVYKNCEELRKDYPKGITKTEHPEVYAANTARDRDKDGAACE